MHLFQNFCKTYQDISVIAETNYSNMDYLITVTKETQRHVTIKIQITVLPLFNPLSDMPILGSSNSAANKDMISKIWTNGYTII